MTAKNRKYFISITVFIVILIAICNNVYAKEGGQPPDANKTKPVQKKPGQPYAGEGSQLPGVQRVKPVHIAPGELYQAYINSQSLKQTESIELAVKMMAVERPQWNYAPEIAELARGLKKDPELIFRYVYDNIENEFFHLLEYKGPYMTLMDKRGNCVDQSTLLVALLREAGYEASFVFGSIELTSSELSNWIGADNNEDILTGFLEAEMIPFAHTTGTSIYQIDHVWVKVNIEGTDYVLDPSLKKYSIDTGVDISNIIDGDTDGQPDFFDAFRDDARLGITYNENKQTNEESIKDVNIAGVISDIESYSGTLIDYIHNNMPDATVKDIIGGRSIIPLDKMSWLTSHPSQTGNTVIYSEWSDIPGFFRAYLRIEHQGIYKQFYSSEIYGRTLTLFYDNLSQPVLSLDGETIATGTIAVPGSAQKLKLTAKLYVDYEPAQANLSVVAGYKYAIVNGWGGGSGSRIIEKHRKILQQNQNDGYDGDSEQVLGEILNLISYTWLAENDKTNKIIGEITDNILSSAASIGVCGQTRSLSIDMPLCILTNAKLSTDADLNASFLSASETGSAIEWGVIDQLQPSCKAISTVYLLYEANNDYTYYVENMTEYNKIKANLTNYSTSAYVAIENYLGAGWSVLLPIDGRMTRSDVVADEKWEGFTYTAIKRDTNGDIEGVANIIGGVDIAKGGNGVIVWQAPDGSLWIADQYSNDAEDNYNNSNPVTKEPIDMLSGSYVYDNIDLAIGNKDLPTSLAFKRSYESVNRLGNTTLGNGWSHNYEIKARIDSDAFKGLGVDSAVDAAATIISLYVNKLIYTDIEPVHHSDPGFHKAEKLMIANMVHKWWMDQLIDNVIVVEQPGNTRKYTKLPDGSYNPPPCDSSIIRKVVNGTDTDYWLMNKNGSVIKFDFGYDAGNPHEGRLAELVDRHSNSITCGYDTTVLDKLLSISNDFGATITLSYNSDDRIEYIQDSAGRRISYTYDTVGNLTNVTNCQDTVGDTSDDVLMATFGYHPDKTGLLTSITYPKTETKNVLFVTNVYDTFDRPISQTNADGYTYKYYWAGCRSEEEDPSGNSIIYNFDQQGNHIAITDKMGRVMSCEYDGLRRKTKDILPSGVTVEYEYDIYNNITSVVTKPVSGSTLSDITESYAYVTYPANPHGSSVNWWINALNVQTDSSGNQTNYDYDFEDIITYPNPVGNLVKVTRPAVYVDGEASLINPIVEYEYELNGLLKKETVKKDATETVITDYAYTYVSNKLDSFKVTVDSTGLDIRNISHFDSCGNISKKEVVYYQGSAEHTYSFVEYHYRPDRLLDYTVSSNINMSAYGGQDEDGYIQKYSYYKDGKVKQVQKEKTRDGSDNTTEWLTISSYDYTPMGELYTESDALNNVTKYEYDSQNRLWKVTDAEEHTTETQYYPDGQVWKIINALGNAETEKTYYPDGKLHTEMDGNRNITSYEYDDFGRLWRTVYPDGTYKQLNYDAAGRLIETKTRAGQTVYLDYDALGRVEYKRYAGRNIIGHWRFNEGSGNVYGFGVGQNGTVIGASWETGKTGKGLNFDGSNDYVEIADINDLDGSNAVTFAVWIRPESLAAGTILYNSNFLTLSLTNGILSATISAGTGQTVTASTSIEAGQWSHVAVTYDGTTIRLFINGQENATAALTGSLPAPSTAHALYVAKGGTSAPYFAGDIDEIRIYSRALSTDEVAQLLIADDIWYVYNLTGNADKIVTSAGTTDYTLDKIGRITDIDYPTGDSVSYSYDDTRGGTRQSMTYPDGTAIYYLYDEIGRLFGIYNDSARLNPVAKYTYDLLSRRVSTNYENGRTTTYQFDNGNRLEEISSSLATDYTHKYRYGYDKVGNRLWMDSTASGYHGYSYDDIYQVRAVDYPEGYLAQDTEYYHDPAHNRQSVVEDSTPTIYYANNLNQYTSVGGVSLTYEDNGNLIDDGANTYVYDCENRLIKAIAGGVTIEYSYDAFGKRISKSVDEQTTYYVYDGDNVILEYTVEKTVKRTVRKFVYGQRIDEPIRMTVQRPDADIDNNGDIDLADLARIWNSWLLGSQDSGFDETCDLSNDGFIDNSDVDIMAANFGAAGGISYYYHYDGLGSVIALTASSGKTIEMYAYDIYGNCQVRNGSGETITSSPSGNSYMFTGREYDTETGNYYYRARYYSPALGRFLQTDPVGYGDSMNLYQYCLNNPIIWVDSWGLVHYGPEETRDKMNDAKTNLVPLSSTIPPSLKGHDYKMSPNDEFTVPLPFLGDLNMSASGFGNMLAGYKNTYQSGPGGALCTYIIGLGYATIDYDGRFWNEWTDGSARDITLGVVLAMYESIRDGELGRMMYLSEGLLNLPSDIMDVINAYHKLRNLDEEPEK